MFMSHHRKPVEKKTFRFSNARLLVATLAVASQFYPLLSTASAFSPTATTPILRHPRQQQQHHARHNTMHTTTNASPDPGDSDLHFPVDQDGKTPLKEPTIKFLAVALLGVPLWASLVLPMTVVYQLSKVIANAVVAKKDDDRHTSAMDSGYVVSGKDMIARPKRTYDVVVLGATGFTGALAVRYLVETYGCKHNSNNQVTWAIAGRSLPKLEQLKQRLARELDNPEILQVPTIVADTSIPATMPNLVRDTRAIVTTAGPFSQYGNSVVEFCAKFGTHYADITGEVGWVKTMALQWQDTAKKSGAKIISFCGHDCIPWDLAVHKLAQTLKEEKNEDLLSVACFDEANLSASGGTFETMRLGMAGKLPMDPRTNPFRNTASGVVHSEPILNSLPWSISKVQLPWNGQAAYGLPFFMAPINLEVVGWTQALREGAPLTYSEYNIAPDFKSAFLNYFALIAFFTSMMNPVSGFFLKKYVLPKQGEGPTMKDMKENYFLSVYAQGTGSNGSEAEAIMYFPRCAGYLDTARMVVESGLSLALDEDTLPSEGGGFFTPAYGLGDVLLNRLSRTGTYFATRLKKTTAKM